MKKIIILTMLLFSIVYTETIAQSGDLEFVSADPDILSIEVGKNANLIVVVNQNGPGNLPVGSARVSVALDTRYVHWVLPSILQDDCGNVWTVHTSNPTATTTQIQLRNNNAILPNNASCKIKIPIVGAAVGVASIIGNSTVFGPGVSDPNGNNQSVSPFIEVTAPLPVTLTSFNVVKENKTALLNWSTTQETNSDHFEIERSLNGKQWSQIGTRTSHGESNSLQHYTFTDTEPAQGENLYRLRMVDKDMTFAYSRIRSISFENLMLASVYPNPAADKLLIKDFGSVKQLMLHNMNGAKVLDVAQVSSDGIDIKHLIPGIYLVGITMSDGTRYTHKIVISQ